MKKPCRPVLLMILALIALAPALAQEGPERAPDRSEGEGPFERLVLRGATLIAGTGSPPIGPVDIVIEGDRIASIHTVGFPGAEIRAEDRPEGGDREIDLTGMYVLPGFIGHETGAESLLACLPK